MPCCLFCKTKALSLKKGFSLWHSHSNLIFVSELFLCYVKWFNTLHGIWLLIKYLKWKTCLQKIRSFSFVCTSTLISCARGLHGIWSHFKLVTWSITNSPIYLLYFKVQNVNIWHWLLWLFQSYHFVCHGHWAVRVLSFGMGKASQRHLAVSLLLFSRGKNDNVRSIWKTGLMLVKTRSTKNISWTRLHCTLSIIHKI